MMVAFKSSDEYRRWSFLESILELGDPILLFDKKDSIWLGKILSNASNGLINYAKERRKKRLNEIKSKAKEIDNKNEETST